MAPMSAASLLFAAAVAAAGGDGDGGAGWLAVERAPGAERCPEADHIAVAVAERLGGRPPFAAGDGVRARVWMGRRGRRGLRARVELVDGTGRALGTRDLSASADAGCEKLAGAVIISLALALDADGRDGGAPAAGRGSVPAPAAALAKIVAVRVQRPRPPAPPERQHAWFGGLGSTLGSLPGVAVGAHAGTAIGRGPIALEGWLGADWSFPARRQGVEVRAWRAAAAIAPCLPARTRFALCVPVRGAVMRAEATAGLARANVVTLPLVEVGARGRAALGLGGPWALGFVADVGVPLLRARLLVDGGGVWRTPPITAWLGVEARWHSR
jgi:hypothetical protein